MAMWIAAPVLVVVLGFIVVLAASDPSGDEQTGSPLLGRQAPPIEAETIDGGRFDLADHAGKYVVVNVFATWCTPCIREHPELVEFDERHSAAGDAELVSVIFDDRVENAREFFDEYGGEWPVVADPDGLIALSYAVARVPESYIIAPDGTVIAKLTGGVTADGLDEILSDARAAVG